MLFAFVAVAVTISALAGLFCLVVLGNQVGSATVVVTFGAMFPAVFSELTRRAIPPTRVDGATESYPPTPAEKRERRPFREYLKWLRPDVIGAATGVMLVILAIIALFKS
jgi:hypothetical protein